MCSPREQANKKSVVTFVLLTSIENSQFFFKKFMQNLNRQQCFDEFSINILNKFSISNKKLYFDFTSVQNYEHNEETTAYFFILVAKTKIAIRQLNQ